MRRVARRNLPIAAERFDPREVCGRAENLRAAGSYLQRYPRSRT